MSDEFLTTAQACDRFPFLQPATLRYWRHLGTGPTSFRANGKVLYRLSSIESWLAAQEAATSRGGDVA